MAEFEGRSSKSYSEKEFQLVSDIMDHVDRLRQAEPIALDVEKAVSLVKRTYQSQDIVLPAELLQRAVTLALSAFPEPEASAAGGMPVLAPVDGWGRLRQWFFGVSNVEAPRAKPTPLDKANALVRQLLDHRLMRDTDLSQVLIQHRDGVLMQKYQALKKSLYHALLPWPLLPAGLVGMSLIPQSTAPVVWSLMFATAILSASAGLGLFCSFLQRRLCLYADDLRFIQWAQEALMDRNYGDYALQRVLTEIKGQGDQTYYLTLESTEEGSSWKSATRAALEDPVLTKVWKQWLESDAPIRRADTDLLHRTARAIQDAKKWLVYCHQMEFPVQAQSRLRAESMEQMNRKSLPAPRPSQVA